jgi:hypothetical protein
VAAVPFNAVDVVVAVENRSIFANFFTFFIFTMQYVGNVVIVVSAGHVIERQLHLQQRRRGLLLQRLLQ